MAKREKRDKVSINTKLLRHPPVPAQGYTDLRDEGTRGFVLRVRASGVHTYFYNYRSREWLKLGDAATLAPHLARKMAIEAAAAVSKGEDPQLLFRPAPEPVPAPEPAAPEPALTLRGFIEGRYTEWVTKHQDHGADTLQRLDTHFLARWGDLPLPDITVARVSAWQTERLAAGTARATINRDVGVLKSALERAIEMELLEVNPLYKRRPLKRIDKKRKKRALTADEEVRLRAVLAARDAARRNGRERGNAWREARDVAPMPALGPYTDHVTPIVLLALLTGLRRGELFELKWQDIDRLRRTLIANGKTNQTREVNLHPEAFAILTALGSGEPDALVFPSPKPPSPKRKKTPPNLGKDGKPKPPEPQALTSLKTVWRTLMRDAKITNFAFHHLRHTFITRLLDGGASPATVRDLVGHSSISVTDTYAHSDEAMRRAAVEMASVGYVG